VSQEDNNRYNELVRSYASRLAEDCPGSEVAIQILVSFVDSVGDTIDCMRGSGNWYARVGMCQQFIDRDKTSTDIGVRERNADSDDGEGV